MASAVAVAVDFETAVATTIIAIFATAAILIAVVVTATQAAMRGSRIRTQQNSMFKPAVPHHLSVEIWTCGTCLG